MTVKLSDDRVVELEPRFRFAEDEKPPIGKRLICLSAYGRALISDWHNEYGFVAWCPLPDLTPEQSERLRAMRSGLPHID